MLNHKRTLIAALVSVSLMGCGESTAQTEHKPELTAQDAKQFLQQAQDDIAKMQVPAAHAQWSYATNINFDTAAVSAYFSEVLSTKVAKLAKEAAKFNDVEVDTDTRRQLDLLKNSLTMPPPADAQKAERLAKIGSELSAMYGSGEYCSDEGNCKSLVEMSAEMATLRDADKLLEYWTGWREVSKPMAPLYAEQVSLANEGAAELGFENVSALWRGKYDMPADDFPKELDRLWAQVEPFYESLHCHVRAKLGEHYGEDIVPQDKPIPAHLLGNMWAQSWGNIYDIVKPQQEMKVPDVTSALAAQGYDEIAMVKQAESFFSSLGFEELPETFWERSMFQKPEGRDVQCHASAWDLDDKDDLRIKMCIQKTGEEFNVIHHELGHNYYQRAYKDQPLLYRGSANDGFHEAIGDTIALSITPKYLKQIDLIDEIPDASNDIGMLMQVALDKIAFIPFGLMVDQWRWKVMSGEVTPEQYNQLWWELREKYQGVMAPVERSAGAFDPGAKYHVPANVPYTRYFLAHILQFQFHKALCDIAGDEGPLNRCSIYGSEEAGKALNEMLEMGMSQPWQNALKTLTGSPQMDASTITDYFAPLKTWLDEQNATRQCGW
ncbi:peptidase M2 family protein [Alteromonas sp. BL110]|uniref:M2 family metallopeptidase n=1 Tax=Alteromonas sp. BL110 TaxID=1714845 RepID=UPI000E4E824A|nr:M2 family metallopeptidase [Alteromonas sp. BL110]AXT40619.1 peptidase M2 family protein [Alteromonas sp. BL110]RKM79855.1 peptidase M2 family protein [Alteromonas sp. BL110]